MQDDWSRLLLRAWKISPAVAVHMGERFKLPTVQAEITKLVRGDPRLVVDVPEALHFLLGERLDASSKGLLKVSSRPRHTCLEKKLNPSGSRCGQLSHPLQPWCISNPGMATTRFCSNTLCVFSSNIQSSSRSSLFRKLFKLSASTRQATSRDSSLRRRRSRNSSVIKSSGI